MSLKHYPIAFAGSISPGAASQSLLNEREMPSMIIVRRGPRSLNEIFIRKGTVLTR
jgi:hypothetical protein